MASLFIRTLMHSIIIVLHHKPRSGQILIDPMQDVQNSQIFHNYKYFLLIVLC